MEKNTVITAGPNQIRNKLSNCEPVCRLRLARSEVTKKPSLQNELIIIFSDSESYEEWTAYQTRSGFSTNDDAMMHLLSVHSNQRGRIKCNVCRSDEPLQHAILNSLHLLKNQADDFNQQPYQSTSLPVHCDPLQGLSIEVAPIKNLTSHDSLPCTSQNSWQHDKIDIDSTHKLTSHDEDFTRSRYVQPLHTDDQPKENNMNRVAEIPLILERQKPQVTVFEGRVQRRNCALREVHRNLKENCSFERKMRRHTHVKCKQQKGLWRSQVQITHGSKQSLICRHCCYRSTRYDFFRHHYLWSHPRMMSDLDIILGPKKVFQSRETSSTCITNVMWDKKHNSNNSVEGPSILKPIIHMGLPESHVDFEHEHEVSEGTTVELSSDGSSCKTGSPSLSKFHPEDAAKHTCKDNGSLDRTELSGDGKSKETDRALLQTTVQLVLSQPPAEKRTACKQSNGTSEGRRRYQCQYCVHWYHYRQGLWRHIKNAHNEVHYKNHAGAQLGHEVSLGQGNSTTGTGTCTELSQIPVLDSLSKRRKPKCTSNNPLNTTKSLKQKAVHNSSDMSFYKTLALSGAGDSSTKTETTLSPTPVLPVPADPLPMSQRKDPKYITRRSKRLTGSVSLAAIKQKPKISLETARLPVRRKYQCPHCVHWYHFRQNLWRHVKLKHSPITSHNKLEVPFDVIESSVENRKRHTKTRHTCTCTTVSKIPGPPSQKTRNARKCSAAKPVEKRRQCPYCVHWFHYRQSLWKNKHSQAHSLPQTAVKKEFEVMDEKTEISDEEDGTKEDATVPSQSPVFPIAEPSFFNRKETEECSLSISKSLQQSVSQIFVKHEPDVSLETYKLSGKDADKVLSPTTGRPKSPPQFVSQAILKHEPDVKLEITKLSCEETDIVLSLSTVPNIPTQPSAKLRKTCKQTKGTSKVSKQSLSSQVASKLVSKVSLNMFKSPNVHCVPVTVTSVSDSTTLSSRETKELTVHKPEGGKRHLSLSNKKKTRSHTTGQCNVQRIKCHYCDHQYNHWQSLWRHVKRNHGLMLSRSQMPINREFIKTTELTDKGNGLKSKLSSSVADVLVSTSQKKEKSLVKSSPKHKESKYFCTKCTNTYCHQQSLHRHFEKKHGKAQRLPYDASKQWPDVSVEFVHTSGKDNCNISAVMPTMQSSIPTIPFLSLASHQSLLKNAPNNHSLLTQEDVVPLEIAEFSCEGHSHYESVIPMSSGTFILPHFEVDNELSQPPTEATIRNPEDSLKME